MKIGRDTASENKDGISPEQSSHLAHVVKQTKKIVIRQDKRPVEGESSTCGGGFAFRDALLGHLGDAS